MTDTYSASAHMQLRQVCGYTWVLYCCYAVLLAGADAKDDYRIWQGGNSGTIWQGRKLAGRVHSISDKT